MSTAKYDPHAGSWTEEAYADPSGYLAHRADLIVSLGPQLEVGDTVLDLACGDAGLAEPLLAKGLRYVGVDLYGPKVAGFATAELHPFFFPQRYGLPRPFATALRAAERSGPFARALLRARFSYVVSASREG